jgi:hypothetical protein
MTWVCREKPGNRLILRRIILIDTRDSRGSILITASYMGSTKR